MPDVALVVPFAGGCPWRTRALQWMLAQYAGAPWTVRIATAPASPWVKAHAVMPAIRALPPDTITVVTDADVWTPGLESAIAEVEAGAPWAIPHLHVRRLSPDATTSALARRCVPLDGRLGEPSYVGVEGGGIVIAHRETLLTIPLDPRFAGWGQEDEAWGIALRTMLGAPWREAADLTHLWHPPQPRATRTRGSMEGWRLRRRYMRAQHDPNTMRQLLSEAHDPSPAAPNPVVHDHDTHAVR